MNLSSNRSGVLLFDKPLGFSSHRVTQIVRRLLNIKKAGHTGSLDPMASGLLPICLGEATKFSAYLLHADKAYQATLQFGATTTTGDKEGEILTQNPVDFDEITLKNVLMQHCGNIMQIPPMYSALKYQGKPLYHYARNGITLERLPRPISIYQIDLLDYRFDQATIFVACSRGTYIRTLAEDIGQALGCGAYLFDLQRVRVGSYLLRDAITLDRMENLTDKDRQDQLLPTDSLVGHLPKITLDPKAVLCFQQGQRVSISHQSDDILGNFRVYADATQAFVGLGKIHEKGMLSPDRLIVSNHIDKIELI